MHKTHSSIGSPHSVSTKPFTAVLAIVAVFCNSQPTMTYPFCIAPWVHASAISFILPECLFIPAAHGISCRRVCFKCISPPYPHAVVSARRLFYLVVLYKRRTMRRELPLDVCEFFRARDRAREFRFCVMPLSEVFRARCRFASRINSSKTSEYVKQPISICKSLQTVRCLLELEHGYGCSEILPGLLVHFEIGKTARRFERAGVRQRAYYFGV